MLSHVPKNPTILRTSLPSRERKTDCGCKTIKARLSLLPYRCIHHICISSLLHIVNSFICFPQTLLSVHCNASFALVHCGDQTDHSSCLSQICSSLQLIDDLLFLWAGCDRYPLSIVLVLAVILLITSTASTSPLRLRSIVKATRIELLLYDSCYASRKWSQYLPAMARLDCLLVERSLVQPSRYTSRAQPRPRLWRVTRRPT